jgi:YgiT-type zinc finger domain-containing protein
MMACPLCKGRMEISKTNLPFETGENQLVLVKDVPARVCKQCGESFVDFNVARRVEDIVNVAKKDGVMLGIITYQEAA